ncbi:MULTISPECIES: hemerythrin domain-containing protein [Sphingobium]|uniref:hemerythrin domain-containing protein n=1 Tax=Sphingobium TaxID=165695 RepID=UPI001BE8BCFA|nr:MULTISPECIES: hemerythrin domain-containing protein [Sphingobium]MBT2245075.1 hemerythrin domain-containing protein [Sphingobium sp. BHU LFT2]WBQ18916.1 hemerythrin domain-containing protein [Sphingobium yanoikuyae]
MATHNHSVSLKHIGIGASLAVLAMFGRKLAVQAPSALAGDWDVALALEHKMALKLFDGLAQTGENASTKRTMLLTQLKHALGKHALEEENAIYPAMREHGLVAEADTLNAEHGYVKQYLYELNDLVNDNSAFQAKLANFRKHIQAHMHEEEHDLFPRLKAALAKEDSQDLTLRMNQEGLKLA